MTVGYHFVPTYHGVTHEPIYKRLTVCQRKRTYATEKQAGATFVWVLDHERGRVPEGLHVYRCRACGYWHLGSYHNIVGVENAVSKDAPDAPKLKHRRQW